MRNQTILHVRLDNLHASIALRRRPMLGEQPFAIASSGAARVLDVCPQAARLGISADSPLWEARARCPGLVVAPPDLAACEAAHARALDLMLALTPQVKPLGITEALLDVTRSLRLFGGIGDLTARLREDTAREVGVAATVGLGSNPLLAKMATELAAPGGIGELREDRAEALAPLSVSLLWTIERRHRERLAQMGVRTLGQLRLIPSPLLRQEFGDAGTAMFEAARGRDDSVIPVYELGDVELAIRHELELPRPTRDLAELRLAALALAERIARSLRERERGARRLGLCLTLRDRRRMRRARTLPAATDTVEDILGHAGRMIAGVKLGASRCATMELIAADLQHAPAARQLSLFDRQPSRQGQLAAAKAQILGRIPGPAVLPGSLADSQAARAIA